MRVDISQCEIEKMERLLLLFKEGWDKQLSEKALKWRLYFLVSFLLALIISINLPSFWWLNIAIIVYFAGSLFAMLRQRAKIYQQLIEHKKQLKLARLLRNFQSSPYSQKTPEA